MARRFLENRLGFGSIFKLVRAGKELANLYVKFRGKEYAVKSPRLRDAERLLCRLRGEEAHSERMRESGKHPAVSVSELLNDVVADYRDKGRATLQDLTIVVRKHLEPAFAGVTADRLSTPEINAYVRRRLKEGVENSTVNRELSALKRAFRLGYAHFPPKVDRIPHIELLPEDNVRTGFLQPDQYERLKLELPPYFRTLFVVAYHVGSRKGELLGLLWPQVELDTDPPTITLWSGTTKNRKGRTLPVYGDIIDELQEQSRVHRESFPNCAFVFHHEGKPLLEFYKTWRSACKRAGVEGLLFHDLRRSAVRNLTRAGVPRPQAMAITGHRTESVYARYDIVDFQDLKDAAAKMERFHAASKGRPLPD
jgi:integrase